MAEQAYAAADLGASSGRVVVGRFNGQRLAIEEVHRFPNGPVPVGPRLYWDVLRLWSEMLTGLRAAGERTAGCLHSVGVDTWGVDFALLGRDGELLGNPVHYRDRRTDGALNRAFKIVPRDQIFAATGLQFMPFNTLYQLRALREQRSPLLDMAGRLLLMPDLFHWLLTGEASNEFTNATTTQFYDPVRRDWARELLGRFQLPTEILGPISPPGTVLGPLLSSVAAETQLAKTHVVLPPTHDTASAVMAVPLADEPSTRPRACYISLGTWALMGVESAQAILSPRCLELNFTNEGGVADTFRVLKNITGLWLAQECRRIWGQAGREPSWDELTTASAAATARQAFIDPDDPAFAAPGDMPEAIRAFCRDTSQPIPEGRGDVVRTALESIALKCRRVLTWLEELVDGHLETIHIVGGGVLNEQLCQWIADACGREVLAGPVEATATGNLMMQALAAGEVGSLREAREVVRRSFDMRRYEPQDRAAWDEAYGRFLALLSVRRAG